MKEIISGTYKTTNWHEQEHSQVEHGPRLTVAEKETAIEGGIQGKATLRYSTVYLSDGSNLFTGHMCIRGRIGDREGSLVVEDRGTGTADRASGTWKILSGSASGDLVGLRGEGAWKSEKGNESVAYTLSYEL